MVFMSELYAFVHTVNSITIFFFAKEDAYCNLTATKEDSLKPVTVSFKEGLGQKFRQPSGTGIDLSIFNEAELVKVGELDIYPLAVKAEASPPNNQGPEGENQKLGTPNSQITQAMFEKKENGEYHVRVMKQILCVNQSRYELQEIYGIGNSVDNDTDGNDAGKECVICLSEPHDTTVLPCRHMARTPSFAVDRDLPDHNSHDPSALYYPMERGPTPYRVPLDGALLCVPPRPTPFFVMPSPSNERHSLCMCSECAKVLRFQTNRCPICRQPVERLLEIKINNRAEQRQEAAAPC
ncbi:hypothetical protein GW17_00032302 [Ensete ventricosum]|nr:hypothetical protein GW17_00032302 [Ensete ventricosum]